VAPATADFLAHLVYGFANDALLATLLVAKCPVVLAPAMHTEMWENPATKENIATLRRRGYLIIDPATGALTGPDSGVGRLPDPSEIADVVKQVVNRKSNNLPKDLVGLNVLISAGGTREKIDPVRFIGNGSSGKQGRALAQSAIARGAKVTLVGANLNVNVPAGAEFVSADNANLMKEEMILRAPNADVVIMNAAVADYYVENPQTNKIKKGQDKINISLTKTIDILSELTKNKRVNQYFVGFAAETVKNQTELIELSRLKLASKNCDLIVGNPVGHDLGIGQDLNSAVLVSKNLTEIVPEVDKLTLADAIWDFVAKDLAKV
jgi:phosphopantothenoylcysteine decarboxylase / phosphopantothenate---cysteine ligase